MNADTPQAWLEAAAQRDSHAPALILDGGIISYGDLADQVHARVRSLRTQITHGDPFFVPMRLDMASIVEIMAVMTAGGVVVPYDAHRPLLDERPPRGTAVCVSTSGTGGRSAMVPLSYQNIAASVASSRKRLGNGPHDRWLATLPLTHVGGLSVLWRSFESGGSIAVAPFDASLSHRLEAFRPSVASLVPTMVYRLLESAPDALAAIGTVLTGGARLPRTIRDDATRHGVALVPTYGMTETTSQVATAIPDRPHSGIDVIGPPLDGFSVAIETEGGSSRVGEPGVIVVDGPAVFAGYLGEPPREAAFATSDIGYMTPEGDLAVIGRQDDVVVTGGENVDLTVVRDTVLGFPDVIDAIVVGVPDPEWGSVVCVLVDGPDPGAEGDLSEVARDRLEPAQRPRRWAFGTIPVLANGKHDVRAVHRRFVDE